MAIQELLINLDQLKIEYGQIDEMNDKQIDKVLKHLTNIGILQPRLAKLGKVYSFEQLHYGLTDKQLDLYAQKVEAYDEQKIKTQIADITKTLSDDGYQSKDIGAITERMYKEIRAKYTITLPSDVISIPQRASTYELIQTLDAKIENLELDEKMRKKYFALRNKVFA